MSCLSRSLTSLRASGKSLVPRSVATLHTSSARRGLNEEDIHRDDRDKEIERHKSDSVEKAKTGRGEWKPELGSKSEQAVRGDKHNMTMEQMQKLGSKKAEEGKNPAGSDSSKGSSV
ncbi:hypothetical protein PV08_09073 [Exophiala spinifera]|uniref:Mitochondrial carrier protein pet8 n=1 Tax=Exophiala spinifera TaxID=91928 RepID=A0A0D1YA20_9EURO|nr:uncharacterized protein PV08_09073 [Exophiala spinifera]KIW11801.1 hypothetical protein PV08_09073 [Exophiala spinifera]